MKIGSSDGLKVSWTSVSKILLLDAMASEACQNVPSYVREAQLTYFQFTMQQN